MTGSRFSRRMFVGAGVSVAAAALLACSQPAASPTPAPSAGGAARPADAGPAAPTTAPAPASAKPSGAKAVELKYLWVTRPGEETIWKETYPQVLARYHPN